MANNDYTVTRDIDVMEAFGQMHEVKQEAFINDVISDMGQSAAFRFALRAAETLGEEDRLSLAYEIIDLLSERSKEQILEDLRNDLNQ